MGDNDSMHRSPILDHFALAVLLLLSTGLGLGAQQPNTSEANLTVNGTFAGPPFPIQVGGLQSTVVTIDLGGGSGAADAPILLAAGRVVPGSVSLGAIGLVDLDVTAPGFAILLNGFDPAFPGSGLARLSAASEFSTQFAYASSAAGPAGLQALIVDPTIPSGTRLTAAADFVTDVPAPLLVTWTGAAPPLWQNNGGSITTPSTCAAGPFVNGPVRITFGGPVDPASLPGPGPAIGSISITTAGPLPGTSDPARGTFSVEDDPRLPPGNARVVRFDPFPPTSSQISGICEAGLLPGKTYDLFVPAAGSSPTVVTVGGQPNGANLLTCFTTLPCNPANPAASFIDPSPGRPQLVTTAPAMGNPSPAPIPAASVPATVSLTLSEALDPRTITLDAVRIFDDASGAQVPGSLSFVQAGAVSVGANSRLDFTLAATLASGRTYRVELDAGVTDLLGNPVELVPGMPNAPLFFATTTVPPVPQPPIVETFQNAQNAASVGPLMSWGGGSASISFVGTFVGSGGFGPMVFGPGMHSLDTGAMPAPPGVFQGAFDTTSIDIQSGAIVRAFGPFPLHLRSLGSVTIRGTLQASAGMTPGAPPPNTGASMGAFNNGQMLSPTIVPGGVGGPGAGSGGRASQGGSVRTPRGETGLGASVGGLPNTNAPPNPFFGGGEGGQSGFRFPSGGQPGELGGLGGAGGSAFAAGGVGGPVNFLPVCQPFVPAVQTPAQSSGIPLAFVPPISMLSGGSGGGGGGDRHEIGGPFSDDQGGGGGGGGGGVRVSSLLSILIDPGATILAEGGHGASGNVFFGGAGGGGSGGQLWLQSFDQISISSMAQLRVTAGLSAQNCTDHGSGAGGEGLIQLEDADGVVNTQFVGGGPSAMNIVVTQFPFASQMVSDSATSVWFDTGAFAPTYTGASVTSSAGVGTVAVTYQGAHGQVQNPSAPNLTTVTAPATGPAALSGHRFIRFTITLSYPPPPATTIASMLPSVSDVTINFSM